MALLDLSLVTQALIRLIEESVRQSPAWTSTNALAVSPQPPDRLRGERTIGLYLYHIREEAHTKAQDWPVDDDVPLRYAPMGLALYYLLTVHSDITDQAQQVYTEQLMMGLAVKALRDYPKLDDATTVGAVSIFPNALRGHENRLRIALQPIQYNEAMQYWTAGQQALRLAAYYEVSAVLLEPEAVQSRRGRVLTYGVHTFVRGTPRLDGSRNRIQFTIPGEANPRELELQPAEATYGAQVAFFGSDLRGDQTALVLRHRRWTNPIEVDAIAWGVAATADTVTATIQDTAGPETILPGIYGAAVQVLTRRSMPDGSTRAFVSRSNETPFAITPRIDGITQAAGLWTVTGRNFAPVTLSGDAIQVYIGPDRLRRVNGGTPAAGQFRAVNTTTLRFRLPPGLTSGTVLPFRLLTDGAESAPHWITVP